MTQKNYLYANILSVACPTCKAAAGQRCTLDLTDKHNNFAHMERLKLRPMGKAKPLPRREPAFKCGSEPSSACKRGAHRNCTGFTSRKHGMRFPCTCHCHILKKKEIANGWETE